MCKALAKPGGARGDFTFGTQSPQSKDGGQRRDDIVKRFPT